MIQNLIFVFYIMYICFKFTEECKIIKLAYARKIKSFSKDKQLTSKGCGSCSGCKNKGI